MDEADTCQWYPLQVNFTGWGAGKCSGSVLVWRAGDKGWWELECKSIGPGEDHGGVPVWCIGTGEEHNRDKGRTDGRVWVVDKTELGGVPPEVASSSSSVVTAVDFCVCCLWRSWRVVVVSWLLLLLSNFSGTVQKTCLNKMNVSLMSIKKLILTNSTSQVYHFATERCFHHLLCVPQITPGSCYRTPAGLWDCHLFANRWWQRCCTRTKCLPSDIYNGTSA